MKFFDDWEESKLDGMMQDFSITKDELKSCTIIFASYTYQDYSGSAFVLFKKGKKLFEVNGGHCSCYGLEGQWEPEETNWKFLAQRTDIVNSSYYGEEAIKRLQKLIKENT